MKRMVLKISLMLTMIFIMLSGCSSSELVLEGVVETSLYSHYSEVSGKILDLPIEQGQEVKAGDLLAVVDDSAERFALEQLQQVLIKKQSALKELTKGPDQETIKQYQNNVALAEIAYRNAELARERAREDYEEALTLIEKGALAQDELAKIEYQVELAESAVDTTAKQLDNARQALALLQKGSAEEKIQAAQAEVALTESQIQQIEENLTKYQITAVCDGIIVSKNFLLGSVITPGSNIADIASEKEKHLVAYVPEEYLAKLSYGEEITIRTGDTDYKGTVSFIDVKAKYTPKELQTSANKNKESMKIKVTFADDVPLKIGEKAQLVIKL